MHPRKFNPKWPSMEQHKRDAFFTACGLTMSTLFEVCSV